MQSNKKQTNEDGKSQCQKSEDSKVLFVSGISLSHKELPRLNYCGFITIPKLIIECIILTP